MGLLKTLLGSKTPQQIYSKSIILNNIPSCSKDSIMDTVDTGFGECNTITIDCPKSRYKTHLLKENYLGEFKNETEKALARNNLGVYSKKETDLIISHIIIDKGLVSKKEFMEVIDNLDFVNSITRSNVLYNIPDKLFKL